MAVAAGSCVQDGGSWGHGERPLQAASVDLRIGAVEAPGPTFGASHTIHDMAATPEGGVLVIDGLAAQVAEFDARGELVRRFGRGGSGPGEFRTPAFVGMRGDTVWVSDEALRRVTYFARDGELIRTVTLNRSDVAPPYRVASPRGPVGENRWVTRIGMGALQLVDSSVERLPILTVDGQGRVRDTLASRRLGPTAVFVARNPENPGGVFVMRQPLANETHWVIPPDGAGILAAEQAADGARTLLVSRISPTGDTVWSKHYPYQPLEPPDELLQAVRSFLIGRVLNSQGLGAETEEVAGRIVDDALYAPEFLPTVTGLVMASDTDFYVRREEPTPDQPQRWTFFSDREPVADVLVPHGIEVHAAADGVLWGVMTDELDVAYVVRLRIGES